MDGIFDRIWERKIRFLLTFFLVFTFSYLVLVAFDFLPEEPRIEVDDIDSNTEKAGLVVTEPDSGVIDTESDDVFTSGDEIEEDKIESAPVLVEVEDSEVVMSEVGVMPLSISFEKLNKTVTVLNPVSRTIADLDTALLDGVVRHPDSATLGQDGNVFILGHSSYLPTVFNKNFQAFNGIQNLEWGDIIEVSSNDAVYEYRVEKVYRAVAQDVTVPIAGDEKLLTLATCNSFGSVDDRYIVEAKQINVRFL